MSPILLVISLITAALLAAGMAGYRFGEEKFRKRFDAQVEDAKAAWHAGFREGRALFEPNRDAKGHFMRRRH
jgi:hypothetical protein